MRGNGWGVEGPPEEAYSRVTNPERFQPLHDAATELLDRLEREFAVERLEGHGKDDELSRESLARPLIRLVPHDSQAAPIVMAFTEFPGLHLRFGTWCTEPFPNCGCDACDETPDELIEKMAGMVEAVVSGKFRESIRVPLLLGNGWRAIRVRMWRRRPLSRFSTPRRTLPRPRDNGGQTASDARVEALAQT